MRKKVLAIMCVMAIGILSWSGAEEPAKASIAVLKFNIEGVRYGIPQEFETAILRDKLITSLVKTRKFNVVERARLDKVIKEQEFSESGPPTKTWSRSTPYLPIHFPISIAPGM